MLKALRGRIERFWQARHPLRDTHQMGQNNIYIVPSRPGLFFCLVLGVLLLASINEQLSLGFMLTFLLTGAGLASMHATHGNLRGLSLDLRAPVPGFAGEDLQLELRVHNPGAARHGIGIRCEGGELAWCDVPAQGHGLVHVRFRAERRGLQGLPVLRIETRFPLGLFRAWSIWRPAAQVWVYPRPESPAAPIQAGVGEADPGERASLAPLRGGVDFDSVRPYRHGDTPQSVLWKKSSLAIEQGGSLWVRDTRASSGQRLWL
ncbi:MAG TPA: DUF58 domain-containing protein, partial [Burkholderiaceae bacterium]